MKYGLWKSRSNLICIQAGSAPASLPHYPWPSRNCPWWCTRGTCREKDLREKDGSILLPPRHLAGQAALESGSLRERSSTSAPHLGPFLSNTLFQSTRSKSKSFYLRMFMFLCMCVYVVIYTCAHMFLQREESHLIPWSWGYRCL